MKRWLVLILASTAITLVAGAAPAFAEPTVGLLPPGGAPGTSVILSGRGFDPGRIEVRWDGSDGIHLATAEGPDFVTRVVIPPTSPGPHTLVVFTRDSDGVIRSFASKNVEVEETPPGETVPTSTPLITPPAQPTSRVPDEETSTGTWVVVVGGLAVLALLLFVFRRYRPTRDRASSSTR